MAAIILNIVPEFEGMNVEDVETYIESSEVCDDVAEVLSEEETTMGSKILFDVLVDCKLPAGNRTSVDVVIFDLEMQRKYNMPYSILDRAIYYASRLLARQSVKSSAYQDLRPVYSTWICMKGVEPEYENSVQSFKIQNVGSEYFPSRKSLINVDLLLISEQYDWDRFDEIVIKFVQAALKNHLEDEDFNPYLPVDDEVRAEVMAMQLEQEKYDDDLMAERQQAKAEGIIAGIAQGKAEGIIAGIAQGRAEGEARLAKLMTLLCDEGRIGDVSKVAVDAEFREKCYKEFNL